MTENNEHVHDHKHNHAHSGLRGKITLIVITSLLLIVAAIIEKHGNLSTLQLLFVYLVPFLIVGYGTLKEACEGIA